MATFNTSIGVVNNTKPGLNSALNDMMSWNAKASKLLVAEIQTKMQNPKFDSWVSQWENASKKAQSKLKKFSFEGIFSSPAGKSMREVKIEFDKNAISKLNQTDALNYLGQLKELQNRLNKGLAVSSNGNFGKKERGQELRQFTEAGIPLVDELAKRFTLLEGRMVSTAEVFERISNRGVSFEMVRDILFDMTEEGGRFYDMQEKISETTYGQIQKLQDYKTIAMSEIGNSTSCMIKWIIQMLQQMVIHWRTSIDTIVGLLIGTLVGKGINAAIKAVRGLGTAFANIGNLLKTNVLGMAFAAIGTLVGYII